jgi:LAO/AO transport system kinase
MLAGAGDELQGIKKGIMEMADGIVITKADGDNINHATHAQGEYQHALHLLPGKVSGWTPPVLTCSALEQAGIEEAWKMILSYHEKTKTSGYFEHNRQQQHITWFQEYFLELLKTDYLKFDLLKKNIADLGEQVKHNKISPPHAASQLLSAYHRAIQESKS